ncbi:MAG: hypothetical protein FJ276_34110, partial [Planctomycetes bacterium]|nr:hypothetical protein [Planctomycetota bacterium]
MPVLHWLQPLAALGLWRERTSMRIAVLCSPGSWYLRDLQRAGGDRYEVSACAFGQLAARLGDVAGAAAGCAENDLARFDGLMVRSMPPGSLEQVVFRMDVLARVERSGLVVLNPPRSLEIAIDKYLALARLGDAGLRIPPTVTCQGREAAMEAFRDLGRDVVIKPLFGSEGRGIARVNDEALALRAFSMLEQLGAVIYLQRFLPHHGFDVRVLVVGDRVLAMRRRNPDDWRTNVSLGATTEPIDVDEGLIR